MRGRQKLAGLRAWPKSLPRGFVHRLSSGAEAVLHFGHARADGRYARTLRQIAKVDLLILDDWGPETLTADQRRDLLEIIDDRHEMRSVIITSQVPVEQWYEIIGNPTIADAVLDRLVHNAYRIELTGESLRKKQNPAAANPQT